MEKQRKDHKRAIKRKKKYKRINIGTLTPFELIVERLRRHKKARKEPMYMVMEPEGPPKPPLGLATWKEFWALFEEK